MKQFPPLVRPLPGPALSALAWILAFAWMLVWGGEADAASVAFRTRADTDVLTFELAGSPQEASVRRNGARSVLVRLPEGDVLETTGPFTGARLIGTVSPVAEGALVELNTNGFGYIFTPVPGQNSLQVQFFRDPTGARWTAPQEQEAGTQETAVPVPDEPNPAPNPDTPTVAVPEQGPVSADIPQVQETDLPAEGGEVPAGQQGRNPVGVPPDRALASPRTNGNSLFSVPYAVRVPVSGLDNEVRVSPSEVGSVDMDTGSARFKAVNTVAEPAPPRDVLPPTGIEVPPSESDQPGVEQGTGVSPADGMTRTEEDSATVAASEPPSSSLEQEAAQAMREAQQAYDQGEEDTPQQVSEEAPVQEEAVADAASDAEPQQEGVRVDDEAVQQSIDTIEAENAQARSVAQDSGLPPEQAQRLEALQLQLLKAQSHVAAGKLREARDELESILAAPELTSEMRLEATYSLGGVLMTLYKDAPEAHFDEITSLYKEAMNADTDSPNIPQALLNLGLINLRVGNLPEARAYFDLLQSQYPDNESVPAVEYYWGEHYYRQQDWQEAADRFQDFIERYPEQERLARLAAFRLAESLKNLGLYDQAFQIVDYIDKRWPQVFESNPGFLKLAGDVEYHLGKLDPAKEHYWTYYNINPQAEQADVVLARIGDVFLRQDKTRAARSIYERVVEQYPDMEGGLIAKMRLAEEGIYDEPTMLEMVTVFDRPFTLRPKQVYTEIVDEHPTSPLAPLALLKLGMWHFYQKEYPEALAAAQRLMDEYPRSELTDRARELGNRAFALAVPQLLDQERYAEVVDYWERYPFINESEGEEGNATRIGVARAYAALDRYDKSLALLKPFLQEEQVPEFSEMALAVAADVYLKQRAWNRINSLSSLATEHWDLSDRARRLLMHANAVALENLGEHRKSARLWAQLGADEDVEAFIRADSLYFMAKEAMKHDDLRRVFVYSQEALSLLLSTNGDQEKIKDCMLMSIHATERSGRYRQALKWALEYDKYVPEDDAEWAGHRYKIAQLYRKSGFPEEWRETMEGLRDARPGTLYGRLAATALETEQLERRASEYAPIPN
ncbi:tetratricopeptide repeat protein [Paucidesulfovibrio gracilis]|uniref:tetratricopeptide repeat protein n=1 Tax=Paucidesulfovibrio gracilis TaxID=47158 RepID=UPI00117C10DC|nr:tetratricopeptide repeat protein [Paucidesulfovibrio gracilis]